LAFEFLLVLADPYIETWSSGAPGYKLLFNAEPAAAIFPAHAFFEGVLKKRLARILPLPNRIWAIVFMQCQSNYQNHTTKLEVPHNCHLATIPYHILKT